jgi:hypothetical protein
VRKYLIGAAAVLFPALMLVPRGQGFYVDWHNHVWLVGYFGEFFRQHHRMPVSLTTSEYAGLAQPVFYGYLFYPLLGLLSVRLHPEVVVRAAAVLLFAAQYVCVRKTLRRLGAAEALASAVACLVVWATYGLTNLYNRSALPEFFATGLVTCAVCSWFDLLAAAAAAAVWRRALRFGLLFTLAAGTHPITAAYSLPLLAVLAAGLLPRPVGPGRRTRLAALAVAALLGTIALAPWLWAVHRLGGDLFIADYAGIIDMTEYIDHWACRLAPLPFDVRLLGRNPADVSTPYLDAQINVPLLVLCVALLGRVVRDAGRGRRLRTAAFAAVPLLYAAAMLGLSLWPGAFRFLPRACCMLQFPYRLVSYVNLGLLLVPLFLLYRARAGRGRLRLPLRAGAPAVLLCFVLTLAGAGVAVKLVHSHAATIPETFHVAKWARYGRAYTHSVGPPRLFKTAEDRERLAHLPPSFCTYFDYTTPHWLKELPADEEASVPVVFLGAGGFGQCGARTVGLARAGHVGTEVAAFPWNRLLVDGREVPAGRLRAWRPARLAPWNEALQVVVPVPAGVHVLEHRFVPERTWQRLHRVAWPVLLAWALGVGCWTAAGVVWRRRRVPAPAREPGGLRLAA